MNKDYKKVVIAIVVIAVIAVAVFFLFRQKRQAGLTDIERDMISFLEEHTLPEDDQLMFSNAVNDLNENPDDASALIIIAGIKYGVNDLNGAMELYLRSLEVQPTNTLALNNLANIYSQKEEYEKSAETHLRLIEGTPKWLNSYRLLMSIYEYHLPEKYPDMEQILLRGIERTSDITDHAPVDLYTILASFYRDTGKINKAIEYFEIALKLMPENDGVKMEIERLKELK